MACYCACAIDYRYIIHMRRCALLRAYTRDDNCSIESNESMSCISVQITLVVCPGVGHDS